LSLLGCKKEESIGFQVSSVDGEITVFLNGIKNTSTGEKHKTLVFGELYISNRYIIPGSFDLSCMTLSVSGLSSDVIAIDTNVDVLTSLVRITKRKVKVYWIMNDLIKTPVTEAQLTLKQDCNFAIKNQMVN
jgi:hypothetical protein